MKKTFAALLTLFSSLSWAEPMVMSDMVGMPNQNVDIRLSDNNAILNYNFRIPEQRIFSFNSLSYNNYKQELIELTTGLILREPTSYGSKFSLGLTISGLVLEEPDFNWMYLSVFTSITDSNIQENTLYYHLSGSISPNVVSFGGVSNVYKAKAELGIHLTPRSVLFVGYNYMKVNSDELIEKELISTPFIGISLNF
jgi:hypothetical protein